MSDVYHIMDSEHPIDTLVRVKAFVHLLGSVDWDSPMVEAKDGAHFLLSEISNSLQHAIEQLGAQGKAA